MFPLHNEKVESLMDQLKAVMSLFWILPYARKYRSPGTIRVGQIAWRPATAK